MSTKLSFSVLKILTVILLAHGIVVLTADSLSASATPKEIEARLRIRGHLGLERTYLFQVNDRTTSMNGILLAPYDLFHQKKNLKRMLTPSNSKPDNCYAGTYEHTVRLDNKKLYAEGCLEDDKFKDLLAAFKSIRPAHPR